MTEGAAKLNRLEGELRERALSRLKRIAGEPNVAADPETLYVYSQCMGADGQALPGAVVMPDGADEVQAIVRLCNDERIPLAAYITGSCLGGFAAGPAPSAWRKGGVIIDLKRMDRIIEVNDKSWYALLEPAVTFGKLKAYLEKNNPGFIIGYPCAPPSASVMAEALASAATNLSTRHGDLSEWISAMEVVMPTGELVRTGSISGAPGWLRYPAFADLAGLFIASGGAAGICTKMAIQVWPGMPLVEKRFVLAYAFPEALRIMREAALTQQFDDLTLVSGPVMKGALAGPQRSKRIAVSENEPAAYLVISFSGANPDEIRNKHAMLRQIVRRQHRRGVEMIDAADLRVINPRFAALADPPSGMGFLLNQGHGGLARLDTRGPGENMGKATDASLAILEKHGIPLLFISRAVRGMHAAAMTFMIPGPKDLKDARGDDTGSEGSEGREKFGACMHELTNALLELGFIPNRPDTHTAGEIMERADPESIEIQRKIWDVIDPNGIMNPMREDDA